MGVPDLVVLGGGVAGLATARRAAGMGRTVVLIERRDQLGGSRLSHGSIASSTLIHSARVAHLVERAPEFGVRAGTAHCDLGAVMDRASAVVGRLRARDDAEALRLGGVEILYGEARFVSPREVEVKGQRIRARRFVIATGARPGRPAVDGVEHTPCLTTDDLYSLRALPPRLAVIGGGPTGVELGQALQRLGSRVTLLESLPEILSREDPELAGELRALLGAEGMALRVGTRVERLEPDSDAIRLICRRGAEYLPVEADALLLAVGRLPNVETLNLEAAGVECDRLGVKVDLRMRTSQRHIYACGDCTGLYPSHQAAEHQAGVIVRNLVFPRLARADCAKLPWVTHTDPELARAGLTEQQARESGQDVEVLSVPFETVDRAVVAGTTAGRAKLVLGRGRILGASLLGPGAGELLHEIVLAMHAGLRVDTLGAALQPYPFLGQIHRRAAQLHQARRWPAPALLRLLRKALE